MASKKGKRILTAGWQAFLLGFLIVFAVFMLARLYPGGLELAELRAYDLRLNARGKLPQTDKVVIVAIDDKSIAELGHWPWPRRVMARLVDGLKDYKAAVVGLDLLFSEPDAEDVQRETIATRLKAVGLKQSAIDAALGAGNDEALAQALRAQGSSYLAYAFSSHYLTTQKGAETLSGFTTTIHTPAPMSYNLVRSNGPAPALLAADAYLPPIDLINRAARGTAHTTVDEDADGELRTELMAVQFHGRYCVPLSLALVSAYRGHSQLELNMDQFGVTGVRVGDEDIPVDEAGRMLVNFRGPFGTFPRYSVTDVINRRLPADDIAGKIVLVGVTATALGDRVVTPAGADYPGVAVHANAVDNILRGDFLRRSKWTDFEQMMAAVVLGIAVSLAVAHLSALWAAATFIGLGAGYFGYAQHRLHADGVALNIVLPLLTLTVAYIAVASFRYVTEGLEKRRLRHAFEHYLHPDVIASVVDDPEGLKLGGERRHLSILFADIVGFTTRAERAESPEALIAELNTYFTRMLDLILQSGGVVDKLIGDAIMAFWGAPAEVSHPARLAIDTALKMLSETAKLRAEDKRFATFEIGIGAATGEPVVGNLGGEKRFDYSVIGDCVNFASRLEGLTRKFGVHFLVSKNTYDEAVAAGGNYIVREIGLVRVKGKHEKLPVVEVVGRADDGIAPAFYQGFARAREIIAQGDDRRAVEELRLLAQLNPHDHLVEMYLEKLNSHLANGNPEPLREMLFEFDVK